MAKISLYVLGIVSLCLAISAGKPEKADHGAASAKGSHYKHGIHNPAFDLDALFGSHVSDNLEELNDEVKVKRLRTLATSHDKNVDGFIEYAELKDWILQSFKMLDHEDANERFSDDDEDKDGKVSFAEILQKQYGYSEEDVKEIQERHAEGVKAEGEEGDEELEVVQLVDDDKRRFTSADLDKDGFLNHEEFMAYIHPYDHPHMFAIEIERSMKDLDKDSNGFISLEEFIGDQTEEETRQAEKSNFEDLDKDKDGKLTPEELRPWALPDNADIADEEVEHLIKECDENGDGKLSVDEVVNKEEEFVGSSATDYGRHLHFVRDEL